MNGWGIDHSTGTPILVKNNCSVIEGFDAYHVLRLIEKEQQNIAAAVKGVELMRLIDAYAYDYQYTGKLAVTRRQVEDQIVNLFKEINVLHTS